MRFIGRLERVEPFSRDSWSLYFSNEEEGGKEYLFQFSSTSPYKKLLLGHLGLDNWKFVPSAIGIICQCIVWNEESNRIRFINRCDQETGRVLFVPMQKEEQE